MLNWNLLKHWQNWVTILLMLFVAGIAANSVSTFVLSKKGS